MNGLNRVILIGHVVSVEDPAELAPVAVVVATHNARKVEGAWVETEDRHTILVAEGNTATFLRRFARVGDLLAVDCVLRPVGGVAHIWLDRIAALHSRSKRDPMSPPAVDDDSGTF